MSTQTTRTYAHARLSLVDARVEVWAALFDTPASDVWALPARSVTAKLTADEATALAQDLLEFAAVAKRLEVSA